MWSAAVSWDAETIKHQVETTKRRNRKRMVWMNTEFRRWSGFESFTSMWNTCEWMSETSQKTALTETAPGLSFFDAENKPAVVFEFLKGGVSGAVTWTWGRFCWITSTAAGLHRLVVFRIISVSLVFVQMLNVQSLYIRCFFNCTSVGFNHIINWLIDKSAVRWAEILCAWSAHSHQICRPSLPVDSMFSLGPIKASISSFSERGCECRAVRSMHSMPRPNFSGAWFSMSSATAALPAFSSAGSCRYVTEVTKRLEPTGLEHRSSGDEDLSGRPIGTKHHEAGQTGPVQVQYRLHRVSTSLYSWIRIPPVIQVEYVQILFIMNRVSVQVLIPRSFRWRQRTSAANELNSVEIVFCLFTSDIFRIN